MNNFKLKIILIFTVAILHSHAQTISPNTVLYQNSPTEPNEYHSHQQQTSNDNDQVSHHQNAHHHHQTHSGHHSHQASQVDPKYPDSVNGHDTLTDFVTFVCQEAESSPQSSQVFFFTFH